jgi:hypothetical protein
MNNSNIDEFIDDIINTIIQRNCKIVICGNTILAARLIKAVLNFGAGKNITGIFDPLSKFINLDYPEIKRIDISSIDPSEYDEVILTHDKEKEKALLRIKDFIPPNKKIRLFGSSNYDFNDPIFLKIQSSLHVKSLAAGYPEMLIHLYQSILYLENNNIEGDILEFGTFRGGTTVFLAKTLEELGSSRTIYSFDTFTGFPKQRSSLDMFLDEKYSINDHETVKKYCSSYNIKLIPGEIAETISIIQNNKIALSFFDTDNYSATKRALEIVYPNTIKGGILAFDHYFSKDWIGTLGERLAAIEELDNKKVFNLHGTGIFIKL